MPKGIYTIITNDKVDLANHILSLGVTEYTVQDVINIFSSPSESTLGEIISGNRVLFIEEIVVEEFDSNHTTTNFLSVFYSEDEANEYSENYSIRVTPEQFLEELNGLLWERRTHE